MKVSVAYAAEDRQVELSLEVGASCTVAMAIRRSGILEQFPELCLPELSVGIFSRLVKLESGLQENDRIEIYRPLKIDPKQARLLRAKRGVKKV